jgi:threonine dehydratase
MAKQLKMKCVIVMARDSPVTKINAIRDYNAEIMFSGPTANEQREMSKQINQHHNS